MKMLILKCQFLWMHINIDPGGNFALMVAWSKPGTLHEFFPMASSVIVCENYEKKGSPSCCEFFYRTSSAAKTGFCLLKSSS